MRLIDADEIEFRGLNYRVCPDLSAQDVIDTAPTIEAAPVIHAEWKTNSNYPDKLICSVCGYKEDMWWADNGTHYCPNCGAKMEDEL